jgi:inosose dehydratase
MSSKNSSVPRVRLRDCLVGANPIIWSNDDFPELAGDVPLDTILQEMREAGYAGTELGHACPRTPELLAGPLARHELRLASGWHSTHLAFRNLAAEEASFRSHLTLLKTFGARVAIVAECTRCVHSTREAALGFEADSPPRLTEAEWPRFIEGLNHLAALARESEIQIVYHHHMGTVVQHEADLERLLASVPAVGLVLDPGHLAFAGIDPVEVARRHAARIGHVHLKSVRADVVAKARRKGWSFFRAVSEGVFTIPGEGAVDFPAIFQVLADEEDPARVPALPKARKAREYVRRQAGV